MRINLLLFLVVTLVQSMEAQGLYPLQLGNVWQVEDADPMIYQMYEARVTGQTVVGGQTYWTLSGFGAGPEAHLLRQAGSIVYAYSYTNASEYALCNFNANVGDTVSIRLNPFRSIVLLAKDSVNFYGRILRRWHFGEEGPAWFANRYIIDSVGMSYIFMEPGTSFYLQGAIINGIQYGTITSVPSNGELPTTTVLQQNYPNPFNPSTSISFSVARSTMVTLKVLNILGQEVSTVLMGRRDPGTYTATWHASSNPSGIYFCKMEAEGFVAVRRMLVLK